VQLGVDDAGQRQTAEGVENLRQMPLVADFIDEGVVRFGLRHQPDAGAGDDAEVGLGEHPFEIRADSPLVRVPGLQPLERTADMHPFAVGKHDLEPAQVAEVVAVGRLADPRSRALPMTLPWPEPSVQSIHSR
jgi:hypothetical protein